MPFETHQAVPLLAADALPEVLPAPPGRDVSETVKELARELPANLRKVGTVTPWAVREGDLRWQPVVQPALVNIELYGLSDGLLRRFFEQHFTLELPYVAAIFSYAPTQTELQEAFAASPYEPIEVHAVYSQADGSQAPRPVYLVWLEQRGAGGRTKGSVERAARKLGGTLVYAQQVPLAGSSRRAPPLMSFFEASRMHQLKRSIQGLGEVVLPPPVTTPANPPAPAPAPAPPSVSPFVYAGAGLAVAVVGYLLLVKK